MPLKTIVIAATKGGTGKTTITTALAVAAVAEGARVALLDHEPQGSLTFWHARRGKPDNPKLIADAPDPVATAKQLARSHDYLFVDTSPSPIVALDRAIEAADLVIIPTHASFFDLGAIRTTVELAGDRVKPWVFLLNEHNPARTKINSTSIKVLEQLGGHVLATPIQERTAYVSAALAGLAAQELPDKRQRAPAEAEIAAVWEEIKGLMR